MESTKSVPLDAITQATAQASAATAPAKDPPIVVRQPSTEGGPQLSDTQRITLLERSLGELAERVAKFESRGSVTKRVRYFVTPPAGENQRGPSKRNGFSLKDQAERFCDALHLSRDLIQEMEVDEEGHPLIEEAPFPRRRAVG